MAAEPQVLELQIQTRIRVLQQFRSGAKFPIQVHGNHYTCVISGVTIKHVHAGLGPTGVDFNIHVLNPTGSPENDPVLLGRYRCGENDKPAILTIEHQQLTLGVALLTDASCGARQLLDQAVPKAVEALLTKRARQDVYSSVVTSTVTGRYIPANLIQSACTTSTATVYVY